MTKLNHSKLVLNGFLILAFYLHFVQMGKIKNYGTNTLQNGGTARHFILVTDLLVLLFLEV